MIEIKGLSHSFGKHVVLQDVDLTVESGKVLGLVGINGAGKSTLFRLMTGIYKPQQGEVFYDGKSPLIDTTRQDIFLLPDDPYFTAQTTTKSMFKLYKTFYPNANKAVYNEIISYFGLDEKKPLRSFSKGMRRQAYIAIAFAIAPKYLLLDEAFDGLDPLARKMFKERIRKHVTENNATVIISSHALLELEEFCDDYVMIDEKHVVASGSALEERVNMCRYQMAFVETPNEAMFTAAGLKVVNLKITGRFVVGVFDGSKEEVLPKLQSLGPAVMDEIALNFEEAFIESLDKRIRRVE
ncbi:MAG: ABC transporter ATP-binding protein [Saccharofermentans sp.]|nr:ABC transporter ATP-binding protein [Saccharofermentans sp.]